VHLTGVHSISVHLTGVHSIGVYLTGVYYLTGVHLMGVHRIGVYLGLQFVRRHMTLSETLSSDKNTFVI
jgi:hypothetical protein